MQLVCKELSTTKLVLAIPLQRPLVRCAEEAAHHKTRCIFATYSAISPLLNFLLRCVSCVYTNSPIFSIYNHLIFNALK